MKNTLPKVLVLEDDSENQKYIYYLLYKKYEPVICTFYEEAVQQLHTHEYKAMIIDIGLHGDKDGLDFIRLVKQHDQLRSIPVICCTAFTMGEDREVAFSAGADAFLSKPVPNLVMLDTLERFITPIAMAF